MRPRDCLLFRFRTPLLVATEPHPDCTPCLHGLPLLLALPWPLPCCLLHVSPLQDTQALCSLRTQAWPHSSPSAGPGGSSALLLQTPSPCVNLPFLSSLVPHLDTHLFSSLKLLRQERRVHVCARACVSVWCVMDWGTCTNMWKGPLSVCFSVFLCGL